MHPPEFTLISRSLCGFGGLLGKPVPFGHREMLERDLQLRTEDLRELLKNPLRLSALARLIISEFEKSDACLGIASHMEHSELNVQATHRAGTKKAKKKRAVQLNGPPV